MLTVNLIAVLFAFTLSLGYQTSVNNTQLRKEIEDIYAKRNEAIKKKDFDYLKSQESDDYTEKSDDGTIKNRQQADAEADQLFTIVREVKEYSTKVESVKEGKDRNEVVVEISDNGRLTIVMPDNKAHEMFGRGRSRDLWVRSQQGWKLKHHEDLGSYVEIDGKPVEKKAPNQAVNWTRYIPEKCGLSLELPGEPVPVQSSVPENARQRLHYANVYQYDGSEVVAVVLHMSGLEPLSAKGIAEGFVKGIMQNTAVSDLSYSTEPITGSRAPLKGSYKEGGIVFQMTGVAISQGKQGWLVVSVHRQASQAAQATTGRILSSIKTDGTPCADRKDIVGKYRQPTPCLQHADLSTRCGMIGQAGVLSFAAEVQRPRRLCCHQPILFGKDSSLR